MRKYLILSLFLPLLIACGEYQKALNDVKHPMHQYHLAEKYFKQKKYARAARLFELSQEAVSRTPQYQRLKYMYAVSLFHLKQYLSAGFQFKAFTQLFPKSSKTEEAYYYMVRCYYELTPEYYRDLTYGEKMLEKSELFLNRYPNSKYAPEVKKMAADIIYRFNKKDFEHAKLYYDLGYYKAAIKSFNNFFADHPGSPLKEDASYYLFLSEADLALNSVAAKQAKRAAEAIKTGEKFLKEFPGSRYGKSVKKYLSKLKKLQTSEITEKSS